MRHSPKESQAADARIGVRTPVASLSRMGRLGVSGKGNPTEGDTPFKVTSGAVRLVDVFVTFTVKPWHSWTNNDARKSGMPKSRVMVTEKRESTYVDTGETETDAHGFSLDLGDLDNFIDALQEIKNTLRWTEEADE